MKGATTYLLIPNLNKKLPGPKQSDLLEPRQFKSNKPNTRYYFCTYWYVNRRNKRDACANTIAWYTLLTNYSKTTFNLHCRAKIYYYLKYDYHHLSYNEIYFVPKNEEYYQISLSCVQKQVHQI